MQLGVLTVTILCTASAVLGAHSSCTDHYPEECARWEGMGECKAIKRWMSNHCPKSCKICKAVPASTCSDSKKACKNWAAKGSCEGQSKDYMRKTCPLSCKVCKPTEVKTAAKTECVDKKPQSCRNWADKGECEGANKDYMLKSCKKSCGVCGKKSTAAHATGEKCVDKKPKSCHTWAENSGCEGSNKDYMLENCKKSCKVCTGAGASSTKVATAPKGADRQKADHNEKAESSTACVDKKPASCQNWAENGECEGSNKDYMLENCKKSCKVCEGTDGSSSAQAAACVDKKPQSCHTWAEHGECKGSNKEYMLENCQKSCKVCGIAGTASHDADHSASTTECVDKKPKSCHNWAEKGECDGSNKEYMNEFCRKSCKLCHDDSSGHAGDDEESAFSVVGGDEATCADSQADCESWAKAGECTNNAQWMNKNCAKSCGKCGGGGVQAEEHEEQSEEEEDEVDWEEDEEEEEVAAPLPNRQSKFKKFGNSVKSSINGGLQQIAGGLLGFLG